MIRLLIADDHAIVREGLKNIFTLSSDIRVSATAVNGDEVIRHLQGNERFDLLLLDLNMPGVSGADLIAHVRVCCPRLPILVFSMNNEPQVAFRMIKAGAAGYLTKDNDPETLLAAIRKVAAGGKYIDTLLAEQLAFDAAIPEQRELHARLSNREFDVFRMLVEGKRVNEIAKQLAISNKTVSTHKLHLMEKMKVGSTAELVYYAVEHGLFRTL